MLQRPFVLVVLEDVLLQVASPDHASANRHPTVHHACLFFCNDLPSSGLAIFSSYSAILIDRLSVQSSNVLDLLG